VFESLLAERFRGFKSELVRCWITKRKKKPKKKKGNDDEVINEELLPWQKWPNISKDDWEAFVIQQSTKEAIVSLSKFDYNCIIYYLFLK
jgi:hypothetical protein